MENQADGDIVIEKIVHALINRRFLPEISYTGRGKENERKIAFNRYTFLEDLLKTTTLKADNSFDDAKYKKMFVYEILKRAPSKYGGDSKNGEKKKKNPKQATQPNAKKATQANASNDAVETPALNTLPAAQSTAAQPPYQPSNHYPSNSQPPITYYPPHPHHQAGHSQQQHLHQQQPQQQPYYYSQPGNFGPNDIPWQAGPSPSAAGADYGHPPSSYFQL